MHWNSSLKECNAVFFPTQYFSGSLPRWLLSFRVWLIVNDTVNSYWWSQHISCILVYCLRRCHPFLSFHSWATCFAKLTLARYHKLQRRTYWIRAVSGELTIMSKQASRPTTSAKLRANTSSDMSPKPAKKSKPIFVYICALCNRGFTRKSTVKDP